jgi:hypothetical protein
VGVDTLAALTAADDVTCITTTSAAAYCWGGIGEREGAPVRVLSADGQAARVRSIAPSQSGVCAVTIAWEAWCNPRATGGWTDSAGTRMAVPGECGYGACVFPLPLEGELPPRYVRAVAAGWSHACALAHDGAAFCWGKNEMGELGNGTWAPDSVGDGGPFSRAPGAVTGGLRFSQLSARGRLTCGVASHNRGVYCWGYGQSGQTGDSAAIRCASEPLPYSSRPCSTATPRRILPDSVPGSHDDPSRVEFLQVGAGDVLACAVAADGRVFCWGDNYRCVLGRCRMPNSPRAQYVPLPGRAVEVHAGSQFACARTADARVFCWGENRNGQLGSLTTANAGPDGGPPDYRGAADAGAAYDDLCFLGGRCSPAAVEVAPGRRWYALAVGTEHACALADYGRVHCWGKAGPALGRNPKVVPCENRSAQWKDEPCQPAPIPVAGLPRFALPAPPYARPAQDPGQDSLGTRTTRVLASRREIRVIFPRDTAAGWGWSELQDPQYQPAYQWSIGIDGIDGPRSLSLSISRGHGEGARRFATLSELVAAADARYCLPGMIASCPPADAGALVENGAVVLTLRDSATIARLVGLRPAWASVWQMRPEVPVVYRRDSVRIEYVDPQVPEPDSALRLEAAAARRRYEASVNSISRFVSAPGSTGDEVWMAVGDSVPFSVEEQRCHSDVCSGGYATLSASGWAVGDSSVVRLRPFARPSPHLRGEPAVWVVARRIGRTTVRVHGLSGSGDTLPSGEPVAREVQVQVVVTAPVARVRLSPRTARAQVGQPLELRAQAYDARGRVIAGAPIRVEITGGPYVRIVPASALRHVAFESPGRHTLVASFGGRADTLIIDVTPDPGAAAQPDVPADGDSPGPRLSAAPADPRPPRRSGGVPQAAGEGANAPGVTSRREGSEGSNSRR